MPTLEFEEFVEVQTTPLDLLEENGKPMVCVFDPIRVHELIFNFVLAELLEKINVFWVVPFFRTFNEIYPHSIVMKKSIFLVSELEIIPDDYLYGIKILQNLRCAESLRDTPLVVISNKDCLAKAQKESENDLKKLEIYRTFTWNDLQSKPDEQRKLFNIVSRILDLNPKL